jgi:DNA-binding MarR family transcriptional regulator
MKTSPTRVRRSPIERDELDDMLEVWAREVPGLDPLTEGIVERIQKLAWRFNAAMDETLGEFGLERRAFQLIGRLRASGPPYRVSAGRLAEDLGISSGAMTNRLDRYEEAGLVRRVADPDDRRGTLVEPTADGHAAWDRAVGTQARREALVAGQLSQAEREELHRLLRRLMKAIPGRSHPHKRSRGE